MRPIVLFIFIPLLFLNFWIWEIFSKNVFVGFFLIIITLLLCIVFNSRHSNNRLFILCLILLSLLQFFVTQKQSLFYLSALEKDIQTKRFNSYVVSIPRLGKELELNPLSIAINKIQDNLVDFFDINYYFFGSYPRELQKPGEFNKLPFICLPFFLIGIYRLINEYKTKVIVYVFISSVLIAIIGDKSHYGLILNYPLILISISKGIYK
jgi:hypothetical protein